MGQIIRIDLGCGNKREEGWIAVDLPGNYSGKAPDVAADLRKLPFDDDYADEARAIHVIEHFQPWEVLAVVREWVRVLKPGAEIAIECPCLDKIVKLMDVPMIEPQYTMWGLYGDPRYQDPLMMHHWCYTHAQLQRLMGSAGLVNIRVEPCRFHVPFRDMRVVGAKPVEDSRIVLPGAEG